MTDFTEDEVRAMLDRHGLVGESFSPEEIAAFLTERTNLNDELDELLDRTGRPDPTAFQPGWAR